MTPGADERREAEDRPVRLTALRVVLHRHTDPDGRRLAGGEFTGQRADVVGRDPGEFLHSFGRERRGALGELIEPGCVLVDVVVVGQPFRDDDVHHSQSQRGVGPRADAHEPVGASRGLASVGVDHHDLGALALRLADERPEMEVGTDDVAAPDHDVARVGQALGVDEGGPQGHEIGAAPAGAAEGALRDRGAEAVHERVHDVEPVQDPHIPQVAVGQDRLGAELVAQRGEPVTDLRDGLGPVDPFETAFALLADAVHGVEQAVGMVGVTVIVADLHAQAALGEGMIRVSPHLGHFAVLDGDQHRARVRTVVRTGRMDDGLLCRHGLRHGRPPFELRFDDRKNVEA